MAKVLLAFVAIFFGCLALPVVQGQNFTFDVGELGSITGLKLYTSENLIPFYTFHGIPYAESTAGDGRFKPSVVRERPLTEDGSDFLALDPLILCPQGGIFLSKNQKQKSPEVSLASVLQSGRWKWSQDYEELTDEQILENKEGIPRYEEDEATCLVLNINTREMPTGGPDDKLRPVILFIHGGSSTQIWGSLFTGFRFLEKDVVLVTINYRLGVLGALNLGIDSAPGNGAMYDSITALKWVNKYIHLFGGDKNSVTVYGHSAGGMMVSHLLLSPLAHGLIHGVIGASGSALAPWGTSEHPSINHHLQVSHFAGCYADENGIPTEDIDYEAIAECMRLAPVETLRSALSRYSNKHQDDAGLGFDAKVPSVQSPSLTIPIFLPKLPSEILERKEQNNVPLIMGAMRHDGSFAFEDIYTKFILRQGLINNSTYLRNDLLPKLLESMRASDTSGALARSIGHTYFGDSSILGDFWKMLPGLIDITSVWGFKAPAYELVEQHAKLNPNSYYYSFDHKGFWSTYDLGGESDIPGGQAHIDDMIYSFQLFPLIPVDRRVSNRFVEYFVNFATYGDPNGLSEEIKFPPYHPFNHTYLKIGKEDTIGYNCRDSWANNALEIDYAL